MLVFSIVDYQPPTYHNGKYQYPWWAQAVGWTFAGITLMCIPIVAIYVVCKVDGEKLCEVIL